MYLIYVGVGQTNSYFFELNHVEVSPVTRRFSALFTRLRSFSFNLASGFAS
jgi:hypothetical protein